MSQLLNFQNKLELFSDHWSPKVIAEMNDYQFKLVKIKGEFTWHNHADTDETFIVLEGSMGIEIKDRTVQLGEGEMCVVPRGQAHKPFADEECKVLLVEPKGVVNTGGAGSELTAENDVWV
ncbi:MAG: cupin domain-containing protein [Deltaproteobacteria bacterium]|jgi:mannose-6-phosphate isomerase-like protein (cupin superfamily)|nr:cupin [Deltaproteobacteria bacterium]MBT7204421.1 cupin domain-containing protein [Deltaproteobacteria bacterium]